MGSGRPTTALQALLPELWTFALRLTSTPEDAEKLLNDAYHGMLAGAWVCAPYMSLRVNMMSIMLRRWHQKPRSSNAGAAYIEANSEMNRRLLQIVAKLPDEQRIAIILIEAEHLTPGEAAWAWGLSTVELQRRLAHAHAAVTRALELDNLPPTPYRATRVGASRDMHA
jgi:DNA-directed RNA polymerase specialized sigma24 family protein